MHILEDRGLDGKNCTVWHRLFGNHQTVAPWIMVLNQPMGCHCVNARNLALSLVLNCNTNVQVGDQFHR